jgi:hypothetical protein
MPEAPAHAELEIGLHRVRPEAHLGNSDTRIRGAKVLPARGEARFDLAALLALPFDSHHYGRSAGCCSPMMRSDPCGQVTKNDSELDARTPHIQRH